jgi:hypothetical protein
MSSIQDGRPVSDASFTNVKSNKQTSVTKLAANEINTGMLIANQVAANTAAFNDLGAVQVEIENIKTKNLTVNGTQYNESSSSTTSLISPAVIILDGLAATVVPGTNDTEEPLSKFNVLSKNLEFNKFTDEFKWTVYVPETKELRVKFGVVDIQENIPTTLQISANQTSLTIDGAINNRNQVYQTNSIAWPGGLVTLKMKNVNTTEEVENSILKLSGQVTIVTV